MVDITTDPSDLTVPLPEGEDMVDTVLGIDISETTALRHMIAAMSPDEGHRSRSRLGLTSRRQPLPPQVTRLAEATVTEAVAFADGSGENLMVELVLPRGVRADLGLRVGGFTELDDLDDLDDSVLRRRASPRNTAAALVSLIDRGNEIMGYYAPLHGKDLKQAFGLCADPAQRARTLAEAAALPHRFSGIALADPGLLIGAARAQLLHELPLLKEE